MLLCHMKSMCLPHKLKLISFSREETITYHNLLFQCKEHKALRPELGNFGFSHDIAI